MTARGGIRLRAAKPDGTLGSDSINDQRSGMRFCSAGEKAGTRTDFAKQNSVARTRKFESILRMQKDMPKRFSHYSIISPGQRVFSGGILLY